MKEQINKALDNIKEFWNKLSQKSKTFAMVSAGGLLLFAIGLTVYLNLFSDGYKVLYPGGLTSAETTQVYATLQSMGANPQINGKSEVMVPADQWDVILFEMASKGIKPAAPTYGVFLDNIGFTTTESDRKKLEVFNLQDMIQNTLSHIKGIESATVVLNIPTRSNYVWDNDDFASTASVTVTSVMGTQLAPENISAIKNLVSSSVPGMKPESVVVVDARTGVELLTEESYATGGYDFKRLEFERALSRTLEDNVKRLLVPQYDINGVVAVASVTVDYDKVVRNSRELIPGADGNGVKTHSEGRYNYSGETPIEGLVGEDQNTDIPTYPNQTGQGAEGASTYDFSIDYDISQVMEQIEKGTGILKSASIAVLVNDAELSTEREEQLVDFISKATNIDRNSISVGALVVPEGPVIGGGDGLSRRAILLLSGGGALLLLIIILLVVLIMRGSRKKTAMAVAENETVIHDLQAEIEQHKRQLMESADAINSSKDNAITTEVRTFAKENPDITASLIRSMLKEED